MCLIFFPVECIENLLIHLLLYYKGAVYEVMFLTSLRFMVIFSQVKNVKTIYLEKAKKEYK